MPINFDNENLRNITIDGEDVKRITVGGDLVYTRTKEIYGDYGGSEVNSGGGGDVIYCDTYELRSYANKTITGTLVIIASSKITIDGTIRAYSDASPGQGGNGTSPRDFPSDGGSGEDGTLGSGGGSGRDADDSNFPGQGGDGSSGGPSLNLSIGPTTPVTNQPNDWDTVFDRPSTVAGAGGGGGGGEFNRVNGQNWTGGNGGDGGRGGGMIALISPTVTGSGSIDTSGESGEAGRYGQPAGGPKDEPSDLPDYGNNGGDGGNGGSGPAIVVSNGDPDIDISGISKTITPTYDV